MRLIVGMTLISCAFGAMIGGLAAVSGIYFRCGPECGETAYGWAAFWPVALVTACVPAAMGALVWVLEWMFGEPAKRHGRRG